MDIKINQIIRSKRKTLSIIIQGDGRILVRAPHHTGDKQIRQFVQSKKEWIIRKVKQLESMQQPEHHFLQGEKFLYLGKEFTLILVDSNKNPLVLNTHFLMNKEHQNDANKIFTNWYRKMAKEIFSDRVRFLSKKYSIKFNKIRISSARTRWGSCSSNGTLSFTWRLVMAPGEIIDYVVLHELIHTKIKNHSSVFWAKINELDPDYKRKRKWLKDNGHKLSI